MKRKHAGAGSTELLLMLSGAVLTGLTLVFPQIGVLEWVSMIPIMIGVFRLTEKTDFTLKRAYRYGFLTVFAYYLVLYHWFINLYPLDFVGMDNASSVVVIAAGWIGLSLLQAIVGGLAFLLFFGVGKTGIYRRFPLLRPVAFSAAWVLFEWSSTVGWTGVPWGRLCVGQIRLLPMLQSASLLGCYFVGWLILIVNALLAYALLYRPKTVPCAVTALCLLAANFGFGMISMKTETDAERSITAAVIQGNVDSHEKWGSNALQITRDAYDTMTRAAAEEGAELIVWPETTLPYDLNLDPALLTYVSDLARECNVTLIVGAFYMDAENDREYNSLYLIRPDGTVAPERYDKRHLVPFGEYVPMRNVIMTLIPPLANVSALDMDLTPGDGSNLFEVPEGKIGALICFDSIYEELARSSVRDGAELMVLSTNDSWFYDSAAVYQHQAQAQIRAIETGRSFVRAANTGISSIVSPDGTVLARIEPLIEGYAVSTVPMSSARTLYSYVGNLFVLLCAALFPVIIAWGIVLDKRKKTEKQ